MKDKFTDSQRQAILSAASSACDKAPVALRQYDAVDLACDTNNYFWQGLDNRQVNAALRLVNYHLTRGLAS